MIVGEHSRDSDLDINPVRTKELTNIRAPGKDENVRLSPPRLVCCVLTFTKTSAFRRYHFITLQTKWCCFKH
jgi:predicted membrane GTPase involved in stress response